MKRAAKITYAAAAVAVAGLVALAVTPFISSGEVASAVSEQDSAAPPTSPLQTSEPDLSAAYARGGDLYDAYVYEGRLLLPPGYAWPAGAERDVVPDEAQRYAWFDWIAAHADAALSGDHQAATDLKTHIRGVPLKGEYRDHVLGLAQGGDENYRALLTMFPLRAGMKFAEFRVDRGPRDYANGTAELDADGLLTSYTLAPGDALWAIAQRFSVRVYDLGPQAGTLHPGDVVRFR